MGTSRSLLNVEHNLPDRNAKKKPPKTFKKLLQSTYRVFHQLLEPHALQVRWVSDCEPLHFLFLLLTAILAFWLPYRRHFNNNNFEFLFSSPTCHYKTMALMTRGPGLDSCMDNFGQLSLSSFNSKLSTFLHLSRRHSNFVHFSPFSIV